MPQHLPHNTQSDKGHHVEQNDPYLEDRHSGVVNNVELITGQMKPPAMETVNPIVCEHEEQEPQQQ